MSWHDPNGPWRRALRKLRLQFVLAISAAILFIALPIIMRRFGPDFLRPIMLPWLCFGVFYFLLILVQGRRVWRFWRASPRIPEHDGHICPHCSRTLEPAESATPCPRCGRNYTSDWVREFWTQAILAPVTTAETRWVDANRRWTRKLAGSGLTDEQHRRRAWVGGAFVVVGLVFLALALNTTAPTPWRVAFLGLGVITHTIAVVLTRGLWGRAEAWPSCPRCGYRYERGAGDSCPECGANWSGAGGTFRRVRTPSWKRRYLVPVAVSLAVLVIMLAPRFFVKVAPTSWLINRVARQSFAWREQRELQSRTLSTSQQEALIAAMMEAGSRHDTNVYTYQIDGMLRAPGISAELRDRFFDGLHTIDLEQRDEGVVVTQVSAAPVSATVGIFAIFGGWETDGQSGPSDRATMFVIAGSSTGSSSPSPVIWAKPLSDPPDSGPIRATVWLAHGPLRLNGARVTWAEDGTPVMPPTVTWTKRIDLVLDESVGAPDDE